MYFTLSWRNIWRNKKRTLIVVASIFFALVLAIVMRSAQFGTYSFMIDSSAKLFTGYLQIQGDGYWDNRSLDKSIIVEKNKYEELIKVSHLKILTQRFEAFSLASFKKNTRVTQVIGISPDDENKMTSLKKKLVKGEYLTDNDSGVLIGEGLAKLLNSQLGDSIVFYGQGYHGQTAAGIYPVKGVVKLPFRQMNNSLIFLSLKNAQELFRADNRITSLPIIVDDIKNLSAVKKNVENIFKEKHYCVKTWDEMMPELKQNIQVDNASGLIMLGILYVVIIFGVFGTVMMMISERKREFGILLSVGMKKLKLVLVTIYETFFITIIGLTSGLAVGIPLTFYLKSHPIHLGAQAAEAYDKLGIEPILAFSNSSKIFEGQVLVIFIISILTIIYPILFIKNLKPIEAVKN